MKQKKANKLKRVLIIAGSDCSGGAGIQADLKTSSYFGVYGMTAIGAILVIVLFIRSRYENKKIIAALEAVPENTYNE